MSVVYNSQDEKYKKPFGALRCGDTVSFSVNIKEADKVLLIGFDEVYKMNKSGELFNIEVTVPQTPSVIYYCFCARINGIEKYITPKNGVGGECIISDNCIDKYQLTVHNNASTPDWFKGAVIYQIYVDRFFRPANNPPLKDNILFHSSWNDKPLYIFDNDNRIVEWDFFGGNLQGVIEKLDYIKGLGVDIIYFNPIFEASSNHKYDTADYSKVDSMYGDDAKLIELIQKAKEENINVILDGVFSHTGDDSIYFNKYGNYDSLGAYQSQDSPYYSWFSFNQFPNDYKSWWGVDALPELDKNTQSYRDFLFNTENGIIKKWMELGIMGWRLDVADELPDDFIKELKTIVRKFCDAPILLGEVWEDASNKISYGNKRQYIINDSLDSVSNYPLRDSIIDYLLGKKTPQDLCRLIMSLQENYPKDVFHSLMNMTGTHDSMRLATILGSAPDDDNLDLWQKRNYKLDDNDFKVSINRMYIFFLILFTLPGNPCIYYGDEMALQGYKDPYNRSPFPWDNMREDLPGLIHPLSEIRKEIPAFRTGFFDYDKSSEGILRYTLTKDGNKFQVIINGSSTETYNFASSCKKIIVNFRTETSEENITLKPCSGIILKLD